MAEVPRGQRNELSYRCREGAALRNSCFSIEILLIPPTPNPIDTSLIERLLFGSQELLHLWEKPLGKSSVCVVILHSSPAAAQQSLLTGNFSSVGYRAALSRFCPSSHEAAVTNSTMWCEVVSLLRSLGSALVSSKCV